MVNTLSLLFTSTLKSFVKFSPDEEWPAWSSGKQTWKQKNIIETMKKLCFDSNLIRIIQIVLNFFFGFNLLKRKFDKELLAPDCRHQTCLPWHNYNMLIIIPIAVSSLCLMTSTKLAHLKGGWVSLLRCTFVQ